MSKLKMAKPATSRGPIARELEAARLWDTFRNASNEKEAWELVLWVLDIADDEASFVHLTSTKALLAAWTTLDFLGMGRAAQQLCLLIALAHLRGLGATSAQIIGYEGTLDAYWRIGIGTGRSDLSAIIQRTKQEKRLSAVVAMAEPFGMGVGYDLQTVIDDRPRQRPLSSAIGNDYGGTAS